MNESTGFSVRRLSRRQTESETREGKKGKYTHIEKEMKG